MPNPTTQQNPTDYGRVRQPYQGETPPPAAPVPADKPAKPAKES